MQQVMPATSLAWDTMTAARGSSGRAPIGRRDDEHHSKTPRSRMSWARRARRCRTSSSKGYAMRRSNVAARRAGDGEPNVAADGTPAPRGSDARVDPGLDGVDQEIRQ